MEKMTQICQKFQIVDFCDKFQQVVKNTEELCFFLP